jgi:hypothetical protein
VRRSSTSKERRTWSFEELKWRSARHVNLQKEKPKVVGLETGGHEPSWSPDGSKIAFSRQVGFLRDSSGTATGDAFRIFIMPASGQ